MDIDTLINYGRQTKNDTGLLFLDSDLFNSNEEHNIKIIETIYNEIKNRIKLNLIYINFLIFEINKSTVVISFENYSIECSFEHIKYIINIAKNNDIFFAICISTFAVCDTNNVIYNTDLKHAMNILSIPHIHATRIKFDSQILVNIDWKKTCIKHIDCYNLRHYTHDFIKWLEKNNQIISLDISFNYISLVLQFINNNPTHSLQYVYTSNSFGECDDYNTQLQQILKNKRNTINNYILTLLLIANSKHKYKQYLPKPIIKYILSFMYDIDYMKNKYKITTFYYSM